jgi:cell division protein FtsB
MKIPTALTQQMFQNDTRVEGRMRLMSCLLAASLVSLQVRSWRAEQL